MLPGVTFYDSSRELTWNKLFRTICRRKNTYTLTYIKDTCIRVEFTFTKVNMSI